MAQPETQFPNIFSPTNKLDHRLSQTFLEKHPTCSSAYQLISKDQLFSICGLLIFLRKQEGNLLQQFQAEQVWKLQGKEPEVVNWLKTLEFLQQMWHKQDIKENGIENRNALISHWYTYSSNYGTFIKERLSIEHALISKQHVSYEITKDSMILPSETLPKFELQLPYLTYQEGLLISKVFSVNFSQHFMGQDNRITNQEFYTDKVDNNKVDFKFLITHNFNQSFTVNNLGFKLQPQPIREPIRGNTIQVVSRQEQQVSLKPQVISTVRPQTTTQPKTVIQQQPKLEPNNLEVSMIFQKYEAPQQQKVQEENQEEKKVQVQEPRTTIDRLSKGQVKVNQTVFEINSNKKKQSCKKCNCEFDDHEFRILACNHRAHSKCLVTWVQDTYQKGECSILKYVCPFEAECQERLTLEIIKSILTIEQFNVISNSSAENQFDLLQCPDCKQKQKTNQNLNSDLQQWETCYNCKIKICLLCRQRDHGKNQELKRCPKYYDDLRNALLNENKSICPICKKLSLKQKQSSTNECQHCGFGYCITCYADSHLIDEHGQHYHRKGCQSYQMLKVPKTNQENMNDEFLPKECNVCKQNNYACKRPNQLSEFQKEHPEMFP